MGFVKGTDGIASTLRNTLEGSVGNIALENISAVTLTSTANVTGGNVLTGGLISATGNVTGGNINTGAQVVATGNITGGNIITGGLVSATSNITSTANGSGGNFTACNVTSYCS